MAADIIYLAGRRKAEPDIEHFRQQITDRKAFHDEFELHTRSAFEVMKRRHPGVMGHLSYEEFEVWLADRIKNRGRMRTAGKRMEEREKDRLHADDFRPF